MIKKQLLLSALVLSTASSTTLGMLNKFTRPAQDALKNQFAATFNFSNIIPESLNTLIAYNKNKRNNAIVRLFLAAPVAAVATLLKMDMIGTVQVTTHDWIMQKQQILDQGLANLLFIGSLVYTAKKGHSAYTRQWMIHHLNKMKNNSLNLFDQQFIKKITHQDIKNSISHATVVPANKKTDATITLNINNPETLADLFHNIFNTRNHILTAV